jgi:hypothetical protein
MKFAWKVSTTGGVLGSSRYGLNSWKWKGSGWGGSGWGGTGGIGGTGPGGSGPGGFFLPKVRGSTMASMTPMMRTPMPTNLRVFLFF